ncbi:DUF6098 family protein [Promicromonospora citrea]|uniref:Uncharacterized protein n=1 Tax=Promicromonospora citrea TaxID=43677 RepID=A0A8H9L5Q3_9MICO|nr:DUF6098 family protein [Promicromonospora citrea]NNH53179.1 hypothetical protein [Promicromonospora citrea]GGM32455.1 hypothetical protein GCM10010102_29870 [Promicromonospora citrea]
MSSTPPRDQLVPGVPHLGSLAEVTELAQLLAPVYVRFSAGPQVDRSTVSKDHESGCVLPGLSVNPMTPEPWWTRPPEHWVARQLRQYAHLMVADRFPWLLTGEVSGRGPDCEPLLVGITPVATVDPAAVEEAGALYQEAFTPGDDGT